MSQNHNSVQHVPRQYCTLIDLPPPWQVNLQYERFVGHLLDIVPCSLKIDRFSRAAVQPYIPGGE